MRFLFTVQGEGRGHFTQALALSSILRKHGHEVMAVLVGKSDSREVPDFFQQKIGAPVFKFSSPNFSGFYKEKRPNLIMTAITNFSRSFAFRESIVFVKDKIEEYKPDMVINFYEMITGMAFAAYKFDKKMGIEMICIGHQYVLMNPHFKTSPKQDMEYFFLRMISEVTSQRAHKRLALSFRDMQNSIEKGIVTVPPLLRSEVFDIQSTKGDYIHGYMLNTGYYEEVLVWHERNPHIPLRFFWDKKEADEVTKIDDNFILYKLNDERFLHSMAGSMGYATTSGFESVCEALYYQKPILMIPVHIEQEFNAHDAGLSGAGVMSKNFNLDKLIDFIPQYAPDKGFRDWVNGAEKRFLSEIV
ncbi:MAG: glycosyltransferase [Dysgonamonadaceae bacterium]|jgi:uncharacterized protein (TIGR00661 family)|nr:glycosyltransferase [Dysgonamonadaceae bacterium]